MPTYQYRCRACKHEFEEFQSMSDDPLVKCPECGKRKLVRVISGAGLVFKGSGFYLTDYKKRGSSTPDGAPAKTPAAEGGTGGTGSGSGTEAGKGDAAPAPTAKTEKKKTPPSGDRPAPGKT